jgi:hypothetical protein
MTVKPCRHGVYTSVEIVQGYCECGEDCEHKDCPYTYTKQEAPKVEQIYKTAFIPNAEEPDYDEIRKDRRIEAELERCERRMNGYNSDI